MKSLLLALVFLSASCSSHGLMVRDEHPPRLKSPLKPGRVFDYYAHLKPEHRTVLQAWLKDKRPLRPAVEEVDSIFSDDPKERRNQIGKDAYQYYSVADFNRDGQEDFAVMLADRRYVEDGFALAVFNGPFGGNNHPPTMKSLSITSVTVIWCLTELSKAISISGFRERRVLHDPDSQRQGIHVSGLRPLSHTN